MIGNWVYNKNIGKNMQVYPMMFSQMFRQNPDATTEDYNIFPVLLMPEILEKNGWIEASGYWVLKGYSTRLGWRNGEMVIGYAALPEKILYVHELQNLMKAVKIEKEMVL